MATPINTLEELRTLANVENSADTNGVECFILLAGGLCRSSKNVWYDGDAHLDAHNYDESGEIVEDGGNYRWVIRHDIDDTEVGYETDEAFIAAGGGNVIKAMNSGALFAY